MHNFLVILSVCVIEHISPALYYVFSSVVPLVMITHCIISRGLPAIPVIFIAFINIFLFIGVSMSVCLHRYFSHKAFDTSRTMQFCLGIISCFAWQGGPLQWAQMHIRHHKFCDLPNDPHSVKQSGFWYAFIGWMADPINYKFDKVQYSQVDYRLRTVEMHIIQKFHMIPPITLCMFVEHVAGYQIMIFACLLPMVLCRFITLLFNVEFHPVGSVSGKCLGVDNRRILAIAVGESRHAEHHFHPRQSHRRDIDIPYWITIFWMEKCNLVWNCR
jgi:stearoyl-CoA desaturase (delta-9 desaturase)